MSLRSRLLLGMALVALVLGLAAIVIARATERHLVDQVDDQLRDARPQLRGPYAPGTGDPGRGPEEGQGGPPARLSSLYLGRIDPGGELHTVYAPNLRGDDVPLPEVDDGAVAALRDGEAVTVGAADADDRYRMLAVGDRRAGIVFVAALPLDDVDEAVRRLVAVEVLAVLAIVAMLGLVTWWVMRLGIRPLRHMTATAGAIAAGDLSQRVPEAAPGTEAGDLGVALNGMLGRIEEAFDQRTASEARLRQFIADASHELRTPITTVRGYAELYQAGALREPADLDEAMRRTQQEAERMGSLVEDLLHLARLDQGRPVERTPVDLAALAADAVLDAQAVAPGRTLRAVAAGPVVVLGDEARLRQVTANLVGNALVHAPDAAVEVRVSADAEAGAGVLEVVDEGPGMSAEDAARAFERFYRADASRQRHRGGSGLGLAIVEATVRAHGGEVGIETAPGEGTTVRVTLPLAPDA